MVDNDGNSYERAAIEWIRKGNGLSPLDAGPNIARAPSTEPEFEDTIDRYRAMNDAQQVQSHQLGETKSGDSGIVESASLTAGAPAAGSRVEDARLEVSESEPGTHLITVDPTTGQNQPTPIDICLVIDVSGSMSTEAVIKAKDGTQESNGLSVLDVVKHAGKQSSRV